MKTHAARALIVAGSLLAMVANRSDFVVQVRAAADDEADWKNSKKLMVLEKAPLKPHDPGDCLIPKDLANGAEGYLDYWQFEVVQVMGANDVVLSIQNPDTPPLWLTGYATKGLARGDKARLVGLVKVNGEKEYTAADGAKTTVPVVRLMGHDEQKAPTAEGDAKGTPAEAGEPKPKVDADAQAWNARWAKDKRVWKDKTGAFSLEAVYDAHLENGDIRLLKADKSAVTVNLSKLSEPDRRKAIELWRASQGAKK